MSFLKTPSPLRSHIYTHDSEQAVEEIIQHYQTHGRGIVSYLYFANAMKYRLFEIDFHAPSPQTPLPTDSLQATRLGEGLTYCSSLLDSHFLLPDGIALQSFYHRATGGSLHNLNGTDFLPFLLGALREQDISVEIVIYGASPEHTDAISTYYSQYGTVIYAQHGYTEFDRSQIIKHTDPDVIRLLLVGRGSPRQELWCEAHAEQIKAYECLALNQGGTFDFIVGEETRAPDWMVRARVLETFWRICTNPKKNFRKFADMFGIFGYIYRRLLGTTKT